MAPTGKLWRRGCYVRGGFEWLGEPPTDATCSGISFSCRAALSAKITGDAARAELSRTRELMEELRQLNSGKTEVPAIDWDHYKSVIKTPGVVEEFQAAFAASSIAPMENTFSSEVASSKSEMTAAAGELLSVLVGEWFSEASRD